jgi:signal transduction histidine kinase
MRTELTSDRPLESPTLETPAHGPTRTLRVSLEGQQPQPLQATLGRICELSARLLRVPAAALALRFEDRSELVVLHGTTAWPEGPDETSFSANTGACATCPVVSGTGAHGTLSAFSSEPRVWTREDEEDLRFVGSLVVRELEVRELRRLEHARDRALDELERVTHLLSSERTTLEEQARELQKYAFALLRSNRELDQFAHVASHDLKAPLRGIASISQWLAEDLEEVLNEESRGHLKLLESRVRRMEGLIDGILRYARAGRPREQPDVVDVAKLLAGVIDMLSPPERFDVRVDGYMPVLFTEQSALEQVFLNLIGNAVNHAEGPAPEVTVSVTDEGSEWYEFSVSDNGPGIAAEHHERIFSMFQTLRPKDRRESTGIGLCIVKRIVERQGGQVWVESEVGRGATFRFLWPQSPAEAKETEAWRIAR